MSYECDWGLGWIAAEPAFMQRASHALAHGGGLWLVDPVDGEGLDERLARRGEVRGVLQLLDRHPRDCAALARRHGVPLLATPFARVPGAPFEPVAVVRRRRWDETALWWPDPGALVVAEALGTAPHYPAPGEPLGVHPLLRLTPPRLLAAYGAQRLLPGHGPPLDGPDVAQRVRRAAARSRRELPRWAVGWCERACARDGREPRPSAAVSRGAGAVLPGSARSRDRRRRAAPRARLARAARCASVVRLPAVPASLSSPRRIARCRPVGCTTTAGAAPVHASTVARASSGASDAGNSPGRGRQVDRDRDAHEGIIASPTFAA